MTSTLQSTTNNKQKAQGVDCLLSINETGGRL